MDRWQDFRGSLDLGNWHNVERRIGTRVAADGIAVRWLLDDDADRHDEGFVGRIVEVSVTGGAVDVPVELPVEAGGKVRLAHGDGESQVTVRHATAGPGAVRYGVEWDRLEEPLRTLVYDTVADARPLASRR